MQVADSTYLGANHLPPGTGIMSSMSSKLEAKVVHICIRIKTFKPPSYTRNVYINDILK